VLEIYSFFHYFDELLNGPQFNMEELYASLSYQGESYCDLVQDIHTCIIEVFVNSLSDNRLKFENYAS